MTSTFLLIIFVVPMEVGNWHILWRAIAGDHYTRIPAEGSTVLYHPAIHAQQADAHDDLWPLPDFQDQPPLLCRVNQVTLSSRPTSDYRIFVRFNLRPLANEELAEGVGGHLVINEPGPIYEKHVSSRDLGSGSISISANMANGLFNPPPPPEIERTPFLFMQEALPIEIKYIRSRRSHSLSAGWSTFRNDSMLEAEDTLIFTRINNNLALGLRRHVPYTVPSAMIGLVILSHLGGDDFDVDYYPQAGPPIVTLIEVLN